MRNLTVCLLLLLTLALPASGQTQGIIDRVEVAGVDIQRLSSELRDAIRGLNGQAYNAAVADQLSTRIQNEMPGMISATRVLAGPDAGRVRLVFVVARSSSAPGGPDSNVNSQYVVEAVEVKGLDRAQYSNAIHDELQSMIGQRLNNDLAEDLRVRLVSEVQGKYFVTQKTERGSMPAHVKVVYEVERTPWLFRVTLGRVIRNSSIGNGTFEIGTPNREKDTVEVVELKGIDRSRISDPLFSELQRMVGKQVDRLEMDYLLEKVKAELTDDYIVRHQLTGGTKAENARVIYEVERVPWLPYRTPPSHFSYHQKQGITFVCCGDDFIGKHGTFDVSFDGDRLTERYKGFTVGLESVELGTRRLGARIEFDSFGVQWKDQTRREIAANPTLPGLYRSRRSLAPSVAFAINRYLYVTAGADLVQLEMEGATSHWRSSHAGVSSLRYDTKEIERGKNRYEASGGYELRTGARNIGSSFSYTRHAFDNYAMAKVDKHAVKLSMMAGKITGNAPMYERFSLGNTRTLRGFNKYDIAPLGGDRVWHYSAEYHYSDVGVFFDQGAVWGNGLSQTTRQSVGLVFGKAVGVAMPLKCTGHECGVTFFVNFQP